MNNKVKNLFVLDNITNLDFMGYYIDKTNYSMHHIVPRREFEKRDAQLANSLTNLCLLNRHTSHKYLHLIENIEFGLFIEITKILIHEKDFGVNIDDLKLINNLLKTFELIHKEHVTEEFKLRLLQ